MDETPAPPPAPPRRPLRWIGVAAALAMIAGIGVAASQWNHRAPDPMSQAAPEAALPDGHPSLDDTTGAAPAMPPGHPPLDGSTGDPSAIPPHASLDPGFVTIAGMHELMKAGLPPTNPHVWVDEVEGVDVSSLTPKQRDVFLRHANAEGCVCGYTVAACRAFNPGCPAGPGKAAALLDSVRTGRYRDARGLRERPKAAPPVGRPAAG
jgi:hypothetical protein